MLSTSLRAFGRVIISNYFIVPQSLPTPQPPRFSGFLLSRGDEIQGVLDGWLQAPEIVRHLRFSCRPLGLRIGIGIGVQEGPIKANPWDMNGPAFHLARLALENARKKKDPSTIIKTGNQELDEILNCIWGLIDVRQTKWTDKQWEAVQAYEESQTYEGAARRLNITFQNVQKRCRVVSVYVLFGGAVLNRILLDGLLNAPRDSTLPAIGKWIGILERAIILIFVACNEITAVAFVLTAKSIARFKQLVVCAGLGECCGRSLVIHVILQLRVCVRARDD